MDGALSLPLAAQYPADTVEVRALADGKPLLIRPLAAGDADLLQAFVRDLSSQSRRQRFQNGVRELAPGLLAQLLDLDYRRSMAFAAIVFEHGHKRMIGEARYAPALDRAGAADFALALADPWQRQGLGAILFEKLLHHAEKSGISLIQGDVLHDNAGMLRLAAKFGFSPRHHPEGAWLTRVERTLGSFAIAAGPLLNAQNACQ